MKKIFRVAAREFVATVATKGFIIGLLVPPLVGGLMLLILPSFVTRKPPAVAGEVAVVDPTGEIAQRLGSYLAPEAIALRHDRTLRAGLEEAPEAIRKLAGATLSDPKAREALDQALGSVPRLTVVALDPAADLDHEKALLKESKAGGEAGRARRLALVVVHRDAVEPEPGGKGYGSYDLFVRAKMDERVEEEIRAGLRDAIVDARVERVGMDRDLIESLTRIPRVRSTTVTAHGEKAFATELNVFLPMGLAILVLMSVLTGGQSLLTTTVEEKSNRIVEVLLSALSPMELMTGKILGQMCVGLLILVLYAGAGMIGLFSFALLGLLDPILLVYLVVFFLITYFVIGALMAAIGAAVNEMREAQTLLTPVMLVMMIPWFLWFPITRNPNSVLAVVLSLTPPVNGFAMLLRMASTTPPPAWQAWLSVAIGAASVYGALWFAAKVFRVGLLMYGKPPNLATLIRWVRMA